MTEPQKGHLALLVFSVLVAGSFSLGAQVANDIAPAAFNFVRFVIAALLVGLAAYFTKGLPRNMWQAPWRYLLLGGVFAAYFILMFEGLKTAPPVSAAAVFTLTPLISAGVGFVLLRQVTTPRMALALIVGAGGALWVIFRADLQAVLQFQIGTGETIYFVGCVSHAIYTPMVARLNRGEAAVQFTFGVLLACIGVALIWGWSDILATDWLALPARVWVALIYVAVFASAMTFVLLQYGSLRLPSAKVMAYTYLVPSWVLIWEVVQGKDVPTLWVLGGLGLTIIALLLLLRDEHQPSPELSPKST